MPDLISRLLQVAILALALFVIAFLIGAVLGIGYCGYFSAVELLL